MYSGALFFLSVFYTLYFVLNIISQFESTAVMIKYLVYCTCKRWRGGRVDSAFDSCSNAAEASRYVTTVGKLFTPTVPRQKASLTS